MNGDVTRVLLVRHGEQRTVGLRPDERVLSDDADGLTDRGRAQVEALAARLALQLPQPVRIVSSPQRRARDTANALSRRLESGVVVDLRLAEQRFSVDPSITIAEASRVQAACHENAGFKTPDGESLTDHHDRVRDWFTDFQSRFPRERAAIVVAHGGTINQILMAIVNASGASIVSAFARCEPARFMLWSSFVENEHHRAWQLEGINLSEIPAELQSTTVAK
jgi:probable phosphoglycerate mutase